jgi:hypothetical protein
MAHVHMEGEIDAPSDAVWAVVGDFAGFVKVLGAPVELEGEGVGSRRTITLGDAAIVERLEELDHDRQRISYSILEAGPLPVQNYRSTMQLTPAGEGRCTVSWQSDFEPQGGASEDDAVAAVRGVYEGGIAGLQKHFGG